MPMAKENMADTSRSPEEAISPAQQPTPNAATTDDSDDGADPFVFVHNTDFIPRNAKTARTAESAQTTETAKAEGDDEPGRGKIALAKLIVDERVYSIFSPIPGFEHLFDVNDAEPGAESSRVMEEVRPSNGEGQLSREVQLSKEKVKPSKEKVKPSKEKVQPSSEKVKQSKKKVQPSREKVKPSKGKVQPSKEEVKPSRKRKLRDPSFNKMIKLSRSKPSPHKTPLTVEDVTTDLEDPDPMARDALMETFNIADVEALKLFYSARFKELTMKPLRGIVTGWVKILCPKRLSQWGAYHNQLPSDMGEGMQPPWWPKDILYNEPSHLAHENLIPLAVDLMQIHRRIDEQSGKRKCLWIQKLKQCAMYCVAMTPTETFSSAKRSAYNEAMKKRASDVILQSLFDIAESHEEYMTRHKLFEGYGNTDPGHGQQVSWQHAARPYMIPSRKRGPRSKKTSAVCEPVPEVDGGSSGNETEMDGQSHTRSSSFASFQFVDDQTVADAKAAEQSGTPPQTPHRSNATSSGPIEKSTHPKSLMSSASSVATSRFAFDESLRGLRLGEHTLEIPTPRKPATGESTLGVPISGESAAIDIDVNMDNGYASTDGDVKMDNEYASKDVDEKVDNEYAAMDIDVKVDNGYAASPLPTNTPHLPPYSSIYPSINTPFSPPMPYGYVPSHGTGFFSAQGGPMPSMNPINFQSSTYGFSPTARVEYPLVQVPTNVPPYGQGEGSLDSTSSTPEFVPANYLTTRMPMNF